MNSKQSINSPEQPEFDLEAEAYEFANLETIRTDNIPCAPTTIGLNNVPGIKAFYFGTFQGFKAGFRRGREIERKAVLEEVLKAITEDIEGIDDAHWFQIKKILNRLGSESDKAK